MLIFFLISFFYFQRETTISQCQAVPRQPLSAPPSTSRTDHSSTHPHDLPFQPSTSTLAPIPYHTSLLIIPLPFQHAQIHSSILSSTSHPCLTLHLPISPSFTHHPSHILTLSSTSFPTHTFTHTSFHPSLIHLSPSISTPSSFHPSLDLILSQ